LPIEWDGEPFKTSTRYGKDLSEREEDEVWNR